MKNIIRWCNDYRIYCTCMETKNTSVGREKLKFITLMSNICNIYI